jgi:hypothetical protein
LKLLKIQGLNRFGVNLAPAGREPTLSMLSIYLIPPKTAAFVATAWKGLYQTGSLIDLLLNSGLPGTTMLECAISKVSRFHINCNI